MIPRPYQSKAVEQCRQQYRDGSRSICLVAPTGAGKTYMAKMMAERAIERGRVGWIVHRDELVEQARDTLPNGVIVRTVQGLVASGERPDVDLMFLDECVAPGTIVGGRLAETVRVGDMFESWDGERVVPGEVTCVWRNAATGPMVNITLGSIVLSVTGKHSIWVEGKGYTYASESKEGDLCRVWGTREGRLSHLARVDRAEIHQPGSPGGPGGSGYPREVYDFEVTPHGNYFANGVLVHNCHHYAADLWGPVARHYRDKLIIGLTATPQRSDGRPLGDLFTSLVVSASYSELIAGGWLVDCEVIAPDKPSGTLAMPPAEAVEKYALGRQSIVFCSTVAEATDSAGLFGEVVTAKTPWERRRDIVARFRAGDVKTLYNVYVLTEGFDAPAAAVCVLARGVGHASTYLQMVGRVLRSAPGKRIATIVDLTGAVHRHNWPTADREYSLEGKAIRTKDTAPAIWQCKRCGMCLVKPPVDRRCPVCGGELPEPTAIRVAREKMAKLKRQAVFAQSGRGAEYAALVAVGKAKGYKAGWARARFRAKFGYWPSG